MESLAAGAGEGGGGDREEHQGRADRSDASEVVDPFPDTEAEDVQRGEAPEKRHREREHEGAVVGEWERFRPSDVDGDPDEIEEERRDIEDVVRPVAPAAHEAMGVSEDLPRPDVESRPPGDSGSRTPRPRFPEAGRTKEVPRARGKSRETRRKRPPEPDSGSTRRRCSEG